jgi:RND family efflux transporter, MFP subunit
MDAMDRAIEPKKGIRKKHIIWGAGIIIIVLLILQVIFSNHGSTYKADIEKLTISTAEEGLFSDYISVIGQVEPISTIYLDAIEGGRVTQRLIEEGSMVKAGDIILKLENRQLYQTILNSETSLSEKENDLRNTRVSFETEQITTKRNLLESEYMLTRKKRTFEQNETLNRQKYISVEEYIQSKEDYDYELKLFELNKLKAKNDSLLRITSIKSLEDDLKKMRLMFAVVRERMEDLNVKAPVDGQLGMLDAEIGQSINAGQRLGQINILSDFKLNASIDEHYIDRVTRGLSGSFERSDSNYILTVRKVYPEVREGQFRIDMVFNGKHPENIRTGQTYQVRLELGESQKALMIPKGGFFQSTGGQWIYVLNNSGTEAVRRPIKIGKQNPQFYEITEGLAAGEKVITSGYELFGDNERLVFK